MKRDARLGTRHVTFPGSELSELEDSSDVNETSLGERFARDGYLFLRGVLARQSVLDARRQVVAWYEQGDSTEEMRRRARRDPYVSDVVEARVLFDLSTEVLNTPTMTYPFKWLRTVGARAATGAHCDAVYMGRGSGRVCTVWIPFGDVRVDQGTLAVCEGSHRLESFRRIHETYGQLDVDRDRIADTGWFTDEPLELPGVWKTADFEAGDIIMFGMRTMHASTANMSEALRVSCDVRFQPENESADPRWVGEKPIGHTAFGISGPDSNTVAELRRKWEL